MQGIGFLSLTVKKFIQAEATVEEIGCTRSNPYQIARRARRFVTAGQKVLQPAVFEISIAAHRRGFSSRFRNNIN
jgi:hypothetical protein